MRITLNGKRWTLKFVPYLGRGRKTKYVRLGDCDHPETPSKTIRIRSDLRGEELADTLLHELIHALDPSKDEEWVERAATDIARVLWRLGFRWNAEEN